MLSGRDPVMSLYYTQYNKNIILLLDSHRNPLQWLLLCFDVTLLYNIAE